MKRTLSALAALGLVIASPFATQAGPGPMKLWDEESTKPSSPPIPKPKPPVYYPPSPPIYHPPTPPVYHPPYHPPVSYWKTRSIYIKGYGTRTVVYRTYSTGLRTIIVQGPKGQERLREVNCRYNTWKAPKDINPFRFQYRTVKAVCRHL